MKKYYLLSIFVFGLLITNFAVKTEAAQNNKPDFIPKVNEVREQNRANIENILEERQAVREQMQQNRDEFKAEMVQNREQLKEQLTANREQLREKLQVVKDEAKQNAVLNISDNFEKINGVAIDRFENLVSNIEKVLENIEDRKEQAKASGIDVSSVEEAITEAKTAIEAARESISIQSNKVYEIEVTDEQTLQEVVKAVRDTFHADLKLVQDAIKLAHEKVRTSAQTLGNLLLESNTTTDTTENTEESE